MSLEIENLEEELDTDDVGQKRYIMYLIFDTVIEEVYSLKDVELPESTDRIKELKQQEGYIYKLAQDFLTSSSTLEKKQKLEKIIEHVKKKQD